MRAFRQSPAVIEGIGEMRGAALAAVGINTLADLLRCKPERIAQLATNASLQQAASWISAAWLLRVEGVTPNLAEAFVAAGIDRVNTLADCGLETLERAVKSAHQRRELKEEPSIYALAEMQRKAGRLRSSGSIVGSILNRANGQPIAEARVSSGYHWTQTDADGYFELHGLAAGTAKMTLSVPGRAPLKYRLIVKTDKLCPFLKVSVQLPRTGEQPPRREIDGQMILPGKATTVRIVTCELGKLPDDTYLLVREIRSGSAILLHLNRTQVGREILADRVIVPEAVLPKGTVTGSIVHRKAGSLAMTTLSLRQVVDQRLGNRLGKLKLREVYQPSQIQLATE